MALHTINLDAMPALFWNLLSLFHIIWGHKQGIFATSVACKLPEARWKFQSAANVENNNIYVTLLEHELREMVHCAANK